MNKILIMRIALGLLGGFLLSWFFFDRNLLVALTLTILIILAAYASEWWRGRSDD